MTPLGLVKLKSARDAMLASPWRWSISCTQKMRMSSPFFHVLNVMTSLDFVTFFEMSLSLCIQTAFELKIWRAFCVSGDTFSISNLHRIQMDNFSKLLIKQESYNPDMNFAACFYSVLYFMQKPRERMQTFHDFPQRNMSVAYFISQFLVVDGSSDVVFWSYSNVSSHIFFPGMSVILS